MDKRILALIADYSAWKGDIYRLVALVLDLQKQIDAEAIEQPVEE